MDKDAGHSVSIGFSPKYKRLNRFANITVCKSALQISSFYSSCRDSTLHLCMYWFSHYLFSLSTFLQTMTTGSYSDPLRVTQTASETSSMPAMWMYVALHCLCVCVCVYYVCVFYSAYNLQGYKCRNKFIAAQGKIRPTLHYRDVHYSDLLSTCRRSYA